MSDHEAARAAAHIFIAATRPDAREADKAAAAKIGLFLFGTEDAFADFLAGMIQADADRKEADARRVAMGGAAVIDLYGRAVR